MEFLIKSCLQPDGKHLFTAQGGSDEIALSIINHTTITPPSPLGVGSGQILSKEKRGAGVGDGARGWLNPDPDAEVCPAVGCLSVTH